MNDMMKTIGKIYYSIILMFLFMCSCNKHISNQYSYVLSFNPDSSTIKKPFFRDSLLITNYGSDSILIKNYFDNHFYQNVFNKRDDCFYEKRLVSNLPENYFGIDSIITFKKKDTTLIYRTKRDNFLVTLVDLSLFDSQYIISREGMNYKTIKQSLVDTTYK